MIDTNYSFDERFATVQSLINFNGGIDTYTIRRHFEEDTSISTEQKEKIITYLKTKVPKNSIVYTKVKNQIDNQEFFIKDYYANPYPRTVRGAYAPVVLKTIAGLM